MPNITLSIPDEVYEKMKRYAEVKWSEVARKAIIDYLRKLEEGAYESSTEELLKELGENFKQSLSELSSEKSIEMYEKQRDLEWRRTFTTRAS